MQTPDSNQKGLRGSKSGFRLPPIVNLRHSIENLEIRESTKRNRIVTEEIENLHQIAIFYGEKLEKEEEDIVEAVAQSRPKKFVPQGQRNRNQQQQRQAPRPQQQNNNYRNNQQWRSNNPGNNSNRNNNR